MKQRTHFVPLVLLAVITWSAASIDAWSAAAGEQPQIRFVNVSEDQQALVRWAAGLYEAAGLDLPPIVIEGHADRSACHDRRGAARPEVGAVKIDLCVDTAGPIDELLIIHELAHAWDHHSLDDRRRTDFLALRGLDAWRSPQDSWNQRGAEHQAEILVWGLIDRPYRPGYLEQNDCADLLAGYRVLTGDEPLHGYTDVCG